MKTQKFNVVVTILFVFILSININAQSQLKIPQQIVNEAQIFDSYPVNAHSYIEKFNQANGIDLSKYGEPIPSLKKTAWNFTVGSTKSWFASSFENSQFYSVPSTCRAVGTNCYIFVEDELWTNGRVDQTAVDAVKIAFDNSTPANPSKGIYQTDVETFGNPPDVDSDNKIIILILNIKDGYSGTGGYVAGYFYGYNQYQQTNSNYAEIYYLDGDPLNLKTPTGLNTGLSTTAHEFQHMIHFNYFAGNSDYTFFNESWSLAAEVVCGYSLYSPSKYANESNQYLFEWRSTDNTAVLNDYSRAARFSLYLKEQFGVTILKKYNENKIKNENGLNTALGNLGYSRRFLDILEDWYIANYMNDGTISPGHSKWGYTYPGLPKMNSTIIIDPNVTETQSSVYNYGVTYITYKGGKNLSISFNNKGNNGIKVKAIKISPTSKQVVDVPVNINFSFPDFGTTYNEITFAVYFSNEAVTVKGPFNFSYWSTGDFVSTITEIKYDDSEPTGVLQLTPGDTVAVVFDGIQGGKLDSIKVALRQAGSVSGGVYRAQSQGTILGQKLAYPITAASNFSPRPSAPYPVPWPLWAKVDLRLYNIDATNAFVAAFLVAGVYAGDGTGDNRVMVTQKTSSSSFHSFTYIQNPSSGTPGWYFLSSGSGTIYLYLIRAYVSFGPTDAKETIELLPSVYTLNQNYPNPFNPETIISFNLPKTDYVEIKIYDALGREIRTLINELRTAGKHNIYWNAKDNSGKRVASGIYFYSLRANEFTETKKMVLTR